ncbi:hypothetical protein BBO99_00003695 [Phytophthora kernoviae]|uniref:Pentacotripeptide-repeat region of PRORP domain-containing protein n=2 Tax=Phytophthora kernoviae TaxID=325452 RepID=A0A3R7NI11_9STRA|nr:hypothetical protein G195_005223 [Phytophthora kernoviae 00238/432]KAG2523876.1 hypothetical protein JM16_003200 [Phytophthora kernoviae]KAG2525692.1 hypothetical protein JM18_003070 [Phytophthora kernoviae]RLN02602.1 hypothetical protein BBI17_003419 [Phytophthora kernoviae]RLN81444.1 hypothetical protein BBO99_00003695 [Phytophthora kernoviae]
MRVLNVLLLSVFAVAAVSATNIDDEITKLEFTLARLKAIKTAEETNSHAIKIMNAVAMASSSKSGSSDSTTTAGDTSQNSEFDIEPQPTRTTTEAPSAESASASATSSTTSSASAETTTSSSASAEASASASSSASTVVPTAFALVSATAKRVLRPQPPADISFPTFHRTADLQTRRSAACALGRFSHQIKRSSSDELLDAWQIMSQCQPFVVEGGRTLRIRLATVDDKDDDRSWLLQIVPADAFARMTATIGKRVTFVGSTIGTEPETDVLVANETLIVGKLVKSFHDMDNHELVVAFFEAYDRDRSVWLQEQHLRKAATIVGTDVSTSVENEVGLEAAENPVPIESVTRLSRAVYSSYLRSLYALKLSTKFVRVFEDDERMLRSVCNTVPNLYMLLHACRDERNGDLARRAIDSIVQHSPGSVLPLGCYELAIRTNLRDKKRGEKELQTALHLARELHKDAGYVLKPALWSALIKVSVNMERPDCALEVFKSYPSHRIQEHQASFRQALRAACRLKDSTALDMMHFCWANYSGKRSNTQTLSGGRKEHVGKKHVSSSKNGAGALLKNESLENESLDVDSQEETSPALVALKKDTENELLNMMLWEMLKHQHPAPSIKQVLDLMEATGSKSGAVTLRLSVVKLFDYDMDQRKLSPREAVENSIKFWDDHSSVLSGQGFLVHLLLDECVSRQYDEECELLVDYLLDLGLVRVPVNSIVKMMASNELRGRFEVNARIAEKMLQNLPEKARTKLRDDFYERYLMSYFRLGQFEKVRDQHADLHLEKRYPHNEVIRTIVRDAEDR